MRTHRAKRRQRKLSRQASRRAQALADQITPEQYEAEVQAMIARQNEGNAALTCAIDMLDQRVGRGRGDP